MTDIMPSAMLNNAVLFYVNLKLLEYWNMATVYDRHSENS